MIWSLTALLQTALIMTVLLLVNKSGTSGGNDIATSAYWSITLNFYVSVLIHAVSDQVHLKWVLLELTLASILLFITTVIYDSAKKQAVAPGLLGGRSVVTNLFCVGLCSLIELAKNWII